MLDLSHPAPYVGRDPPATSYAAASAIAPRVGSIRRRIFDHITRKGCFGATDQEIQGELNLTHETETPSRFGLVERGLVKDSGATRKTRADNDAIVWIRS